jgi:hypothetical protein
VQAALRRARWSRLLLAVYLACLGLVCSFILFEVLDVDGSDFMPISNAVAVKPAESRQDDLDWVLLAALVTSVLLAAAQAAVERARADRVGRTAVPRRRFFAPTPATRMLLARSALADAPSA